jgi:hypothetical protein
MCTSCQRASGPAAQQQQVPVAPRGLPALLPRMTGQPKDSSSYSLAKVGVGVVGLGRGKAEDCFGQTGSTQHTGGCAKRPAGITDQDDSSAKRQQQKLLLAKG